MGPAHAAHAAAAAEVAGGGQGQEQQQEEEYDPLDAFMASVDAEVASHKPTHKAKPKAELACDEGVDAADYMAVRGVNRVGRGKWVCVRERWRKSVTHATPRLFCPAAEAAECIHCRHRCRFSVRSSGWRRGSGWVRL